MKIYLDNCCLQRPLDNKAQLRIALEAQAILSVLSLCMIGEVSLVSSKILQFEVGRNPNSQRRVYASEILAIAVEEVRLTDIVVKRAKEFEARGFKALDSLHLASAEAHSVDFFCTCDDRFLKLAKQQTDITLQVLSPLELAEEVIA